MAIRISNEQIGLVIQARMAGANFREIGKRAGLHYNTAKRIVRHLERVGHYREFTLAEPLKKPRTNGHVTNSMLTLITESEDGLTIQEIFDLLAARNIKTTVSSVYGLLKKQHSKGVITLQHGRYFSGAE